MFKTCTGSKKCKKSKPGSSKTCTGSNKCKKCKTQMQCQRSGLEWSGLLHFLHLFEPVQVLRRPGLDFLHFLSLCRFWSLGCLKPAQAQTKFKKSKPESSKTCTGSRNATNAKPRCNVRGQGLIGLAFCIFCIFLSLCRFWGFQVWIFAFFEPVQVLEPWALKTCTGSKKSQKKQILYLFLKNGRQIGLLSFFTEASCCKTFQKFAFLVFLALACQETV